MDPTYSLAPPVEIGPRARTSSFLAAVFSLYRDQFRTWFAITAPTSLLASAILYIADQRIRAIVGNIPPYERQHHVAEIALTIVLRFGAFFLVWLLGNFALAAIATEVNGLNTSEDDHVWRHDSHQRARESFASILLVSAITFCAFLVGMGLSVFVEFAFARIVSPHTFVRFAHVTGVVLTIVVASVASWLGMAVPLVVRDGLGAWQALKRSVRLSEGYEGALFLLVVASVAGSYAAWYATYYSVTFFVPDPFRYTAWYGWALYIISILASAAVEPPLFIGFSLLADPDRLIQSFPMPIPQQSP